MGAQKGFGGSGLASASVAIGVMRSLLAVPVVYLATLTGAAWFATLAGRATSSGSSTRRFAVLVPAHDEEQVIAETLDAIAAMEYPATRYEVHVLADHCTDRTAELARAAGATVHELDGDVRGKGPALSATIVGLLDPAAPSDELDAVVVVDADTIVAPEFLAAIDAALERGAEAVQGQYRVRDPGESTGAGLRAIALASRHHLRPLGRTALGGSSGLYGNGMAFTRRALADRTWSNHLTEDIELQMELLFDGILVAYAPDAVVEAEMPATLEGAVTQNERWERGRLQLARRYVPRLLSRALTERRGRIAAIDAAADHLVPPLSVLVAAVGAVTAVDVGVSVVRRNGLSFAAFVLPGALVVHVLSAIVLGGVPRSAYRSLLHAPEMIRWKTGLWLRMLLDKQQVDWVRTGRTGAAT